MGMLVFIKHHTDSFSTNCQSNPSLKLCGCGVLRGRPLIRLKTDERDVKQLILGNR